MTFVADEQGDHAEAAASWRGGPAPGSCGLSPGNEVRDNRPGPLGSGSAEGEVRDASHTGVEWTFATF